MKFVVDAHLPPSLWFQSHLPAIIAALEHSSLVELDRRTVQAIV
jgi:hypothetical protein